MGLMGLIEAAFDAVLFTPGEDMIRQYLRDGRLALVLDGFDDMSLSDRSDALQGLSDEFERYPRTAVLLPLRSLGHPALQGWRHARVQPLAESDVERAFRSLGYPNDWRVDALRPLEALATLPFWAPALARYGRHATSGPELLEAMIRERVESAMAGDPVIQLKTIDATAFLALWIRPSVDTDTSTALSALAAWGRDEGARARFTIEPAESMLDRCRSTGLVAVEGQAVRFVHPLLAAHMAAARVVAGSTQVIPEGDDELAAFVAAGLPEARHIEWLRLMADANILVLARALRLVATSQRASTPSEDLPRYEGAVRELVQLAGPVVALRLARTTTALLIDGDYLCLRRVDGEEPILAEGSLLDLWKPEPEDDRYTCWRRSPFTRATPEMVAAEYVLALFKAEWRSLRPEGSPFAPMGSDARSLLVEPEALGRSVLTHVIDVATARESFLAAVGLEHELEAWKREPHVKISSLGPEPRFVVSWGHTEARVERVETPDGLGGQSILDVLADAAAASYHDLTREIEDQLGSSMSSGALGSPSPFDWSL